MEYCCFLEEFLVSWRRQIRLRKGTVGSSVRAEGGLEEEGQPRAMQGVWKCLLREGSAWAG